MANAEPGALYKVLQPPLELGLPFVGAVVGAGYFSWPRVPELLPASFPGVKTSRDDFLVSIDKRRWRSVCKQLFRPCDLRRSDSCETSVCYDWFGTL